MKLFIQRINWKRCKTCEVHKIDKLIKNVWKLKTLDWISDGNIFLIHDPILLLYRFDKMQTESANIQNLKIEKIQSSHDKN